MSTAGPTGRALPAKSVVGSTPGSGGATAAFNAGLPTERWKSVAAGAVKTWAPVAKKEFVSRPVNTRHCAKVYVSDVVSERNRSLLMLWLLVVPGRESLETLNVPSS